LEFRQPDGFEKRARAPVQLIEQALGAPEVERRATLSLKRDAHVLEHGQVRKHRGDLERAYQAHARYRSGTRAGDVVALVHDAAARGLEEVRQEVEAGRLPGAVRADEGVDAAAVDLEVDVLDRDETPELLGQLACFKNAVVAHAPRPGGLLPGGLSTRTADRATPAICRASAA